MPRSINPDKPQRKRSGVSTVVAVKTQADLKVRVHDLFGHAKHFCMTNEEIHEKYEHIMRSPAATRAPEWVRFYIRGVYDTLRDELHKYYLVWVPALDGKLMTPKEVDEITAQENHEIKLTGRMHPRSEEEMASYKSPWSRIDRDKSRTVWTFSNGAPRLDKPFDQRHKVPNLKLEA